MSLPLLLLRSWLCLLLVSMAVFGCRDGKARNGADDDGHSQDDEEPLSVATLATKTATIDRHYVSSGTLQALRSAEIVALQPGVIRDITVEEGDKVGKGDTLARLDGRELQLQADAARVQVGNLERELDRLQSLPRSVLSQEELDKQRYAVEEARATASLSRFQAKQTVVRAPFAGTITARHVDEGNLAGTSTPLFSLADLSILQLELHLPEREAGTVTLGSNVVLEMVDGTTFDAAVVRKAPVVDALTGTVKFTVQAKTRPAQAVPGAFTRARVLVEHKENVPTLPKEAVFELEGQSYVYVVEDGQAHRRQVTLGSSNEERVEILAGVGGDDRVVAEGVDAITEGMDVKPLPRGDLTATSSRAGP